MGIQNPSPTSIPTTPPPQHSSPSPSSSSSHSSPSSIITAASSSTDSSSQSSHSPSSATTRCDGLDLLLRAIHHVATTGGISIVGVPYIQRRSVMTRRRRRSDYLRFNQLFMNDRTGGEKRGKREGSEDSEPKLKKQRRSRGMALPSKYQDSVLQPWRLRSRSGIKIND